MPPVLKQILDVLEGPVPTWAFILVILLHFGLTHLRPILDDKRKADEAETHQLNANKEEILDLSHKAILTVDETRAMSRPIYDDAMTLAQHGCDDSERVKEIYDELVQMVDLQLDSLSAFHSQLRAIDRFNGSHSNLLRTKTLCKRIERIRAKIENSRIDMHNQIQSLIRGPI